MVEYQKGSRFGYKYVMKRYDSTQLGHNSDHTWYYQELKHHGISDFGFFVKTSNSKNPLPANPVMTMSPQFYLSDRLWWTTWYVLIFLLNNKIQSLVLV